MSGEVERVMDDGLPSEAAGIGEDSAGSVNAIAALALASRIPAWVTNPATGDRFFVGGDGAIVPSVIAEKIREDPVDTIEALVSAAALRAGEHGRCEVFVGKAEVVAVCDPDGQSACRVVLGLGVVDSFSRIGALREVDQKSLVKGLRTIWRDSYSPDDLVETIREVTFRVEQESGGEVARGRESVKGSVSREVRAVNVLPPTIGLRTPVYECLAIGGWYGSVVTCTLDTDLESEKFEVVPAPGEMLRVRAAALNEIGSSIRSLWPSEHESPTLDLVVGGMCDLPARPGGDRFRG